MKKANLFRQKGENKVSRTILTFMIAHNLTFTKKSIAQFTFGSWASFDMQYNFLNCHKILYIFIEYYMIIKYMYILGNEI